MAELIDHGGRVYAEALFRAADEAGRVPAVDADLRDFMESLASDRGALGSLLNPRLPHESKQRIVAALLKDADPLVRNAMLVLVDNGRLALLHDVSVAYAELAAEQERILDIEVTTAVELGSAQVAAAAAEHRAGHRPAAHGSRRRSTPPSSAGSCCVPAASSWTPRYGASWTRSTAH